MFIIGGLILVKVFQNRHPDIHANAFIAFFSFAVVILFTLIGIVSVCVCVYVGVLLQVLGPASGVCLALGPVFPQVAHRGPSLNWSGGAYPH